MKDSKTTHFGVSDGLEIPSTLGKAYLKHVVFDEIKEYANFFSSLSYTTMGFVSSGCYAVTNINTHVFTSIQGTLESIHDVLHKGRINDSYALLRKYYDSAIMNIYTNLYLQENFSIDNFIVEKIDNWVKGKEKIPSFKVMSTYIINSPEVTEISKLIYKDSAFTESSLSKVRDKCNEHTHYFFYHNLLYNDNEIYLPNRVNALNNFSLDLREIFILHISYLFYINDYYMSSTDYGDYMDCGKTPEEGSQYWVASFVQDIFDSCITKYRPDITEAIKTKTCMKLE